MGLIKASAIIALAIFVPHLVAKEAFSELIDEVAV